MKGRIAHRLLRNKSNARPSHVIFIDTETIALSLGPGEKELVFRLGVACYQRSDKNRQSPSKRWWEFRDPRIFWAMVDSHIKPRTKLYIVAHNVAFDWRVLGGHAHAKEKGWELRFAWDKGMVTSMTYWTGDATVQVLSSTNFYPIRLKELGELVGLPKFAMPIEGATEREWVKYCKRDVAILVEAWRLWLAFLDEHDLGQFRNTLASQAFAGYRHRFMHTPITIHGDMDVCKLERESYRGGRTECFRAGEQPEDEYYQLDVNGMYAYMMQKERYPYRFAGKKDSYPVKLLRHKLRKYAVIARVKVRTEIPVFPVRHNGVNVYPVGEFETVLTTPELEFALENCEILEVKDIAWYREEHIFEDYATYFSDLKLWYEHGQNLVFRQIAKGFMNSLYGKFGQRDDRGEHKRRLNPNAKRVDRKRRILPDWLLRRKKKHYVTDLGSVNAQTGRWTRPEGWVRPTHDEPIAKETRDSFPAIPAHVAAYARLYLWDLICKAGKANVFYCDTDGIIVNRLGMSRLQSLLHDHDLGRLKVEATGKNLTIYAPKDYTLDGKAVCKGIRKNAIPVGDDGFKQEQFLGQRGAQARDQPDLVTVKSVVKRLQREIKTGTVGDDGVITPFRFPL